MWLLTLMCLSLVAFSHALTNYNDRVVGRVIHIETLLQRGRWLWQNDNYDADGAKYLYMDKLDIRDTYYTPRVQFDVRECGGGSYLCLESLSLHQYYLTAGYPAGGSKKTVKLQNSVYVEDDDRFHWSVECELPDLEKCKLIPRRFRSEGLFLVADNWGSSDGYNGGHYDATLGSDSSIGWMRVHAPNPTDGFIEIFYEANQGNTEHAAIYRTTIGVSHSDSSSQTITSSTTTEVGGAFKAFSASVSSTIESSWTTASSTTYGVAVTVENDLVLPPHTAVRLMQLRGNYANAFNCDDSRYEIQEIPLESGATRIRRFSIPQSKIKEATEKLSKTSGTSPVPSDYDKKHYHRHEHYHYNK